MKARVCLKYFVNDCGLHLVVCFDTMMENLITILFHLRTDKIKAAHDEEI